tara:strand:- start:9054 stop:9710 length:657 start_codon:yes stop_codon:yes gene_type:complete
MPCSIHRSNQSGFTLIEISLAVAITGILLAGVYQVARTTFELSSDVKQVQALETTRTAFVDFVRRELRHLPAEAGLTHQVELNDDKAFSALTVEGAPTAFGFGAAAGFKRIELVSEPELGGTLRVLLRYHQEDLLNPLELPLLQNLTTFEWQFYDSSLGEWSPIWINPGRRPSQIELLLGFSGEAPRRYVFWSPQIIPPQLLLDLRDTTPPQEEEEQP